MFVVAYRNRLSRSSYVKWRVPQDLVLGPTLFIVYYTADVDLVAIPGTVAIRRHRLASKLKSVAKQLTWVAKFLALPPPTYRLKMTVTAIHAHRLTPLFAIKAKTWTDELLDTLLIFFADFSILWCDGVGSVVYFLLISLKVSFKIQHLHSSEPCYKRDISYFYVDTVVRIITSVTRMQTCQHWWTVKRVIIPSLSLPLLSTPLPAWCFPLPTCPFPHPSFPFPSSAYPPLAASFPQIQLGGLEVGCISSPQRVRAEPGCQTHFGATEAKTEHVALVEGLATGVNTFTNLCNLQWRHDPTINLRVLWFWLIRPGSKSESKRQRAKKGSSESEWK